jgi:hypothetical protein
MTPNFPLPRFFFVLPVFSASSRSPPNLLCEDDRVAANEDFSAAPTRQLV